MAIIKELATLCNLGIIASFLPLFGYNIAFHAIELGSFAFRG